MPETIYLDFDGTLVDSSMRQYQLFCDLVGSTCLDYTTYWRMKRSGMGQAQVLRECLGFNAEHVLHFSRRWLAEIEDTERLKSDVLVEGCEVFLKLAQEVSRIVVVSGRQHYNSLLAQISWLGIDRYLDECLVTEQKRTKASTVKRLDSTALGTLIIGDSCEDIQAGRELGIGTIGVASGASSKRVLLNCVPDLVLQSVGHINREILCGYAQLGIN